jgi:pyroglutamyl-peptidase
VGSLAQIPLKGQRVVNQILITGFEPFQGESLNPSGELARQLKDKYMTLVLPVSYEKSWQILEDYLLKNPEIQFVISLGQAGGRCKVGLERIAVNLMDTEIPDESGQVYKSQEILSQGKEAYFSHWPLREWVKKGGGNLEISNSAGLFVCNSIYYQTQNFLRTRGGEALFVHLPFVPDQLVGKVEGTPALSLDVMRDSVNFVLGEIQAELVQGKGRDEVKFRNLYIKLRAILADHLKRSTKTS